MSSEGRDPLPSVRRLASPLGRRSVGTVVAMVPVWIAATLPSSATRRRSAVFASCAFIQRYSSAELMKSRTQRYALCPGRWLYVVRMTPRSSPLAAIRRIVRALQPRRLPVSLDDQKRGILSGDKFEAMGARLAVDG